VPRSDVLAPARGAPWAAGCFSPGVLPVAVDALVAAPAELPQLHGARRLREPAGHAIGAAGGLRARICWRFVTAANLPFHLQRSWDVYAICFLALASAAYSLDPPRTLQYGAWLLLRLRRHGTGRRVRQPNDVVAVLCIVLLPASFFTAIVNVTLGPVVRAPGASSGRSDPRTWTRPTP
jgi:hypothetical protein